MAPPNVQKYVESVFAGSPSIKVSAVTEIADLEKNYPLMAAVNRAARSE